MEVKIFEPEKEEETILRTAAACDVSISNLISKKWFRRGKTGKRVKRYIPSIIGKF